jgi:REP element-mobilizing transposase RayT
VTYLITFACYGCHIHGEERGSVDRKHNLPGGPVIMGDARRLRADSRQMLQPAYGMDGDRRRAVLTAIRARCLEQNWVLMAAHVRTNHVHVVLDAGAKPERVMNDLKSYASRCLNRARLDDRTRKRWARHGSTRWLWARENISAAIRYVIDGQGEAMAVFED